MFMFICRLSKKKKKKKLHSTRVYQTQVLCKFFFLLIFFLLKVLEPGIPEYYVAWYSSLPSSSTA